MTNNTWRAVPTDSWYTPAEDETFTNTAIVDEVINLMRAHGDEVTALVAAEWERKDEPQRGSIRTETSWRTSSGDDALVLTLELRLPPLPRGGRPDGEVKPLIDLVHQVLDGRARARHEAEVARLEADHAARVADVNRLEAELVAARARLTP